MQNGYAKTYLYVLGAIAAINLILGLAYLFTKIPALWAPLLISSLVELIVFFMSIVMIIVVFVKKLSRINLVIPIVYLLTSLIMSSIVSSGPDTSNMSLKDAFLSAFDFSIIQNLIMFSINVIFYLFLIGFSLYLLKNDEHFRQGD